MGSSADMKRFRSPSVSYYVSYSSYIYYAKLRVGGSCKDVSLTGP